MTSFRKWSRFLPLVIGLGILLVILLLAPWEEIGELLEDVPPQFFASLFALSIFYFVVKAIRFWYILRLLDIKTSLRQVALLYISGQPFSILPAGELYRTVLLKKHLGISVSKSAPSITLQGLVEAIVLIAIALGGAFVIGEDIELVIVVAVVVLLFVLALQRGWLAKAYVLLDKLPFVSVDPEKFQMFIRSHQQLLRPKSLSVLILFSLLPVLTGVGILYLSSKAIGADITFIQAMIGYCLPTILAGLSFLPGGLGVNEGTTIGVLRIFGVSLAPAITITLLVRIFHLGAGIVYGAIAQSILHFKKGGV